MILPLVGVTLKNDKSDTTNEIVMVEIPLFFTLMLSVLLVPTFTVPNGILAGVAENAFAKSFNIQLFGSSRTEVGC